MPHFHDLLSVCPECGRGPAIIYVCRNGRDDLPWDASCQCESYDSEWTVPLSASEVVDLAQLWLTQRGPAIDWGPSC